MRVKDAFKSGLTIGIGFVGVNLVIGMLVGNLEQQLKNVRKI